jgi:hypothetical protein
VAHPRFPLVSPLILGIRGPAAWAILATRSSTGFGIDVGGGVNLMVTDKASVYVEARYHYIWGPELKDEQGVSQGKANGQFFPITFGVRF